MEGLEIQHNTTRKRAMLAALEKSYGIVTKAAKSIDLDRTTHYRWLEEDAEYRKAVEELDNVALDHSEDKLHQLIEGVWIQGKPDEDGETQVYQVPPNVSAVIFHLKTRGKKRGYVEKETTAPTDAETIQPPPITYNVVDMSLPKDGI